MRLFRAIARTRGNKRTNTLRTQHRRVQDGEAAHRQPDQVSGVAFARIHDSKDVPGGSLLGIGIDGRRNVGWRVPARSKGDASVTPGKCVHLRFPAPVTSSELVHEQDWRSGPFRLEIQPDAVIACCVGHPARLHTIEWRDEMPPSTVMTVPEVYPERSEARKTMRSTTSRTLAGRPRG